MTMKPIPDLRGKLEAARRLSWKAFGKVLTFYVPGMVRFEGIVGRYQAVSITGSRCSLGCEHCKAELLRSMPRATSPEALVETCLRLEDRGYLGVLLSGGCDDQGRLPWARFLAAIREVKDRTGLFVSVHCGLVDEATARGLKEACVDQALIDVVGDDETFRRVCHVPFGVSRIVSSLEALEKAGLDTVPHVVCGLDHGRIRGERKALEIIGRFRVSRLVIVSVMETRATRTGGFRMPGAESIAGIIAEARLAMPDVPISLGCARQRGNRALEVLAIDAGVNRMALPSEEALARARHYGMAVRLEPTCCSV